MRPKSNNLLNQMRILEVGKTIAPSYCAVTLAKLGASVIKMEHQALTEDKSAQEASNHISTTGIDPINLALNHSKKSVTVDFNTSKGLEVLRKFISETDLLITDSSLDEYEISTKEIMTQNPSLVIVTIFPFRPGHKYGRYATSDLSLFHMSGNAHGMLGPVDNPSEEPPIRAGGQQTEMVSGMTAATASMIGMYRKFRTGSGCHIIVSKFESMVTMAISGLANQAFGKTAPSRRVADQKESSIGGMVSAIGGVLPCNDGFVAISPREDSQWERWLDLMGRPDWSADQRFVTRNGRQQNVDALWELLSQWSRTRSKFDIARSGQKARIPCFPVNTLSDLMSDPHLESRDFFVSIEHPDTGSLRYPGNPFKINGQSPDFVLESAPHQGQHNEEFNIE